MRTAIEKCVHKNQSNKCEHWRITKHTTFLALPLARTFSLLCAFLPSPLYLSISLAAFCFLWQARTRVIWTNFYLVNYFRARCVYRYRDVVDVYIVYLFLLAISIGSDLVPFDNFILAFMNYPERRKNVVVFIVE